MSWKLEEAALFSRVMETAEIPGYLTVLFYLSTSIVYHGFLAPQNLVFLCVLLCFRMSYPRLRAIPAPRTRFWINFALYQIVQVFLVVSEASGSQDNLALNSILSTVLMMNGEVSPIHSYWVNAALVTKHLVVWVFVTRLYLPHQSIRVVAVGWVFFNVMIMQALKKELLVEKETAEIERKKEQKRLKCLLLAIPDGVGVIDENGNVLLYNPTLLKQLRISDSKEAENKLRSVIGNLQYDKDYLPQCDIFPDFLSDLRDFMRQSLDTVISFKPLIHDSRHLECRGCLSTWDDRRVVILTVRDTSNWVLLEKSAKLDSAKKTALLRSVSHELRTPVNAIVNIAQDLSSSGKLQEKEKTDVVALLSASHFLISMIDDLLDYSRICYDKFSLSQTHFSPEKFIRGCGELIETQCREKNLGFHVRYDSLLPTLICTDENRLKQIVLNLLSNAVK